MQETPERPRQNTRLIMLDKNPSPPNFRRKDRDDADELSRYWSKEQRKQLVIVVPDSLQTDIPSLQRSIEHDPVAFRIMLLGKPMACERFETSKAFYRDLVLKMIASGIPVIHQSAIEETNA